MTDEPIFPVDLGPYKDELKRSGDKFAALKKAMEEQRAVVRSNIIAAVRAGVTEAEAARLSGVPRKTVRDWQGKK